MVIDDVLPPNIRDSDICVAHMVKGVLQLAIETPITCCHIQQTIARETRHLAGVSALLVQFGLCLGPLPTVVAARCCLTAFVHPLDGTILLDSFSPVSG